MDTPVRSSGLHVQGSCQDKSMAGMSEVLGLAGMCWRGLVGFGNMRYSSQVTACGLLLRNVVGCPCM
jgi:hypothetical protein